MRILLFSGKGGVGKTSIAAATGVRLAEMGHRTLVMSVDPAHSLADAFDLETALFHGTTSAPHILRENLSILEVNIQKEISRHWKEISSYISSLLKTSGLSEIEAEEMAIFPGMEELSAMMYVKQFLNEQTYDIIVLDCAPTAESLRFVSMPTTLAWYMKHIFPMERRVLKAVRPLVNRVSPIEMPSDRYFGNIRDLFDKIAGIDKVLADPAVTSVRLVTNPEKMVLRETQRAFVYFSLHGLTVDQVIVNRVLPAEVHDPFFGRWRESQAEIVREVAAYFAPVPIQEVPLFTLEVLGYERLREVAAVLFPAGQNPAAVTMTERPYSFIRSGNHYEVRLQLPFAEKGEIGLFKKDDELVVEVGTLRRHIGLPTSMASLEPVKARQEGRMLVVEMRNGL